jgi:hypothetical protein
LQAKVQLGSGVTAVVAALGAYSTCAIVNDVTQIKLVKCWGWGSSYINGQANGVRLGDAAATTPDNNPAIKYVILHSIYTYIKHCFVCLVQANPVLATCMRIAALSCSDHT